MTDAERAERKATLIREETTRAKVSRWWLSFAKDDFAGVAIVNAFGPITAVEQAWLLQINPGGAVHMIEVPDDQEIPPSAMNRLLSKDDCRMYFGKLINQRGEQV